MVSHQPESPGKKSHALGNSYKQHKNGRSEGLECSRLELWEAQLIP